MTPDELARGGNPGREPARGCLRVAVPAVGMIFVLLIRSVLAVQDRGGPVDGERSISGRACLPLLIVMFGVAALLVGSFAVVAVAVIR